MAFRDLPAVQMTSIHLLSTCDLQFSVAQERMISWILLERFFSGFGEHDLPDVKSEMEPVEDRLVLLVSFPPSSEESIIDL